MDPDTSKIQLLARLVQLYKEKETLAPNVLVAEWARFLQELQKEQGTWDEAFKRTSINPAVADKMRIEVTEKVNTAQQQLQSAPKQEVPPTKEKPKTQEPLPTPPKEQQPSGNILDVMFSETMKTVRTSPDEIAITQEMMKDFKIPKAPPTKPTPELKLPEPQPMKPKVGPEFDILTPPKPIPQASEKNPDISNDLQNLDAILESSKVPTKDGSAQMESISPISEKPTAMKIEHDSVKDKGHIVVESHDQQHIILSNLNNTIDKYWGDITEVTLTRGIPKNILTKFDWIYEKNPAGEVVLTIDSFGDVTLEEKAYAKEVGDIIEQFVKKESEFNLIKKIATHEPEPPAPVVQEDIQEKASLTLEKLEKMTKSKPETDSKSDSKVFSNVMNVMDNIYEEKPKQEVKLAQQDVEFLEQLGVSHSHLATLSSSLFEMARKELGSEGFGFKSPADPKARQFAKWIYDKIPSLIGKQIDDKNRKKLATRLFINIWEIIR